MDEETGRQRKRWTAGAAVTMGLLGLAVPVLWFVGAFMTIASDACSSVLTLPICDADVQRLVGFLPVSGAVVGLVIGLAGGIRAVNRDRKPHLWLTLAWVPPVVALVVAGNLASTEPRDPESTTAERVRPAPVPTDADTTRWRWHPPEGVTVGGLDGREGLDAVVPGGAGVIVGVVDGVIALDGVTGKERWHYRAAGDVRTALAASPNGELVAFNLQDAGTVVLDAMTGRLVSTVPGRMFLYDAMTNHAVTRVDDRETRVSGVDPRKPSAGHRWDFAVPAGCELLFDTPNPKPSADVATVGMACGVDDDASTYPTEEQEPVTVTLVGLDDRTGAERWRYTRENVQTAEFSHAHDGTVLLECDNLALAIDPATGTVRVNRTVRGDDERIPAPGAQVFVTKTEVVGSA